MKTTWALLAIILASALVSISAYQLLPEKVAVHWGLSGEPDSWGQRDLIVSLVPAIMLAIYIIYLVVPRVDPLARNIEKFKREYDMFFATILLFLLYIHILVISWNLGLKLDMGRAIALGLGPVFWAGGILMERSERAWFVGFRTPWTLSSEKVWEKTNRLCGKLFKLTGLVSVLAALVTKYAGLVMLALVLVTAVFGFVFSYLEYEKERKRGKKK